jgi:signal transduction histidine kinase
VEITPLEERVEATESFRDTTLQNGNSGNEISYRRYTFMAEVGGTRQIITLQHVLPEVRELSRWLWLGTALVFLIMVAGLFWINRRISKWAWRPFYRNLSILKNYDITKKSPVVLEASGISEFEALNRVVSQLMHQVEKDFRNLKEFNENISHEMQTPLAIIRNKMVLLLERPALGEKELQWIQAAYQEVNKLSKIGKSLTLISRIENQEFTRLESVDVRSMVENILGNMEEIIEFKGIQLATELKDTQVQCDPVLANVLFTNLIRNALQHNQEGGYISIELDPSKFEITNSGEVLKHEPEQLFKRFQTGSKTTGALGLGLAISQRICELYQFALAYEHDQEGKHRAVVHFPAELNAP